MVDPPMRWLGTLAMRLNVGIGGVDIRNVLFFTVLLTYDLSFSFRSCWGTAGCQLEPEAVSIWSMVA